MRFLGFLPLLLLTNCAARTPLLTPPVVDMAGVDQNKYNTDLSECTSLKVQRNGDTVWTDSIISDCMEKRGYRVLQKAG
jgi:hypothetical protein